MEKPKLLIFLDRHPFIRNQAEMVLGICLFLEVVVFFLERNIVGEKQLILSGAVTLVFALGAAFYWYFLRKYLEYGEQLSWASEDYERRLKCAAAVLAVLAVFNAVKCAIYFIGS